MEATGTSCYKTIQSQGRAMAQAVSRRPLVADPWFRCSGLWTKWHWDRFYSQYFGFTWAGIATRYGLDGPGIESRWGGGDIFRTRPDRPWGPPSLLYNGYLVSFPGVKRPGRGVDHPPSSSAIVKERVELYFYSPSGPSGPLSRENFTFTSVLRCQCPSTSAPYSSIYLS
jgi:hypothetical protein